MLRRLAVLVLSAPLAAQSFVNWETAHVHPLATTPDGSRLLAVNTPDDRLEVFDLSGGGVVPLGAVPVGLDPVSVRARNDGEAWVVNHVSDSVSIVDLGTMRVVATLDTDDEPADVVFAGTPERAFVSCSQANTLLVFDPLVPSAPPAVVPIAGEDPRALARSADGAEVYVAIFESGNGSTILGGGSTVAGAFPPNVVGDPAGPYGGQNPPPNAGAAFDPPIDAALPTPPEVGLIVKKDDDGSWMDDNGGDWTAFVSGAQAAASGRPAGWDLPDRDVAIVDAGTLAVSYATRCMNACMALAVNPANDEVTLVGTDGINEVRFEPVLTGVFGRVLMARIDAAAPATLAVTDLNPHLDYTVSTLPQAERDKSLGDPRGIVWNASGTRAYVTGMGSNNVVVVDATGARAGLSDTIEVGEGPTGVVLDAARERLYVLDRFEAAVSVVDTVTETETARVPFHDPTPAAIRTGRRHLYDTHETSGLGQVACATCHVDARMDRLAWDLGDPTGEMKDSDDQNQNAGLPLGGGGFPDFHPMKGPMLTQTLQDIIGKEPHHWRGDRDGLEEFAPAFIGLQGDDATLTAQQMQEYEDFLATIHMPPNPFRELDNSLPTDLPLPGHLTTGRFGPAGQPLPNGDAQAGLLNYRTGDLDAVECVTCHTLPTGLGTDMELSGFNGFVPIPPGPNGERHHALVNVDGSTNVVMKVPQLRTLYERVGFETNLTENVAGFGFLHDGSVDSLARFVNEPVFALASDQETADMVAFMLAFSGSDLPEGDVNDPFEPPGTASRDTHAAVGTQTTLVDGAAPPADQVALLDAMEALVDDAAGAAVGLVVKGVQGGEARGYSYLGAGTYQSDRAAETVASASLRAGAAPGAELTWTVVPLGTQTRIGVDRDEDGAFDRDELDAGTDPADPDSVPGGPWVDLGQGKAGSLGVPALAGSGPLTPGSDNVVTLTGALPGTTSTLVVGLVEIGAPFKGGTLVPSPDFLFPGLPVDGAGAAALPFTWPLGTPAGVELFWQHWILDAGASQGLSASNALRSTSA